MRLGLVGCGSRGVGNTNNFLKLNVVDVGALCDVYSAQIDQARTIAPVAKAFKDHRHVLDMKELDAVIVAVPDHGHAAITIDALNAGKDVYVEKPLTLRIEEGAEIVKAARVNTATFQATLVPSIGGAGIEFCGTEGRLVITRARFDVIEPKNATPVASVLASGNMDQDHMQNFVGVREVAKAAERRRAHRSPIGVGFAPRQHCVCREAPDPVRSGARNDHAVVTPISAATCRTPAARETRSGRSAARHRTAGAD